MMGMWHAHRQREGKLVDKKSQQVCMKPLYLDKTSKQGCFVSNTK